MKKYKIGDIGPGGGIVFRIKGGMAQETSKCLGLCTYDEASERCEMYNGGGYNDWYLPSIELLELIYENLQYINPIIDDNWYWSSTPLHWITEKDLVWSMQFSLDKRYDIDANKIYCVRAVRKFEIK